MTTATKQKTNAERLKALKALPLPAGAQFSIKDVTNANHKPHPYTIGPKHIEKSDGIIDESLCRRVPCAHPRCNFTYEQHTSDVVCFIEVSAAGELKDVPNLQPFLVSIKDKATELGVDGFAFVEAPKPRVIPEAERLIFDGKPGDPSAPSKVVTTKREKKFGPRPAGPGWPQGARIWATVSFDDDCRNGHNTFAITGDIRGGGADAGGCLHDDIAEAFPELAPFIKWHLCDTTGPMHGIANTIYHAGNRDCWGLLKGEPKSFDDAVTFGSNPITHKLSKKFAKFLQDHAPREVHQFSTEESKGFDFEVLAIEHENRPGDNYKFSPKYTFGGYADKWHECPFDTEAEALNFLTALQTCEPHFIKIATSWGEGKERELDAARRSAIWPDATDEELTAPGLKERLEARLPALLLEFRAAVESLGFEW